MTIEGQRTTFTEESKREDEWTFWNPSNGMAVVVADQGITNRNRFNVMVGEYRESEVDEEMLIIIEDLIEVDQVFGYEAAMARAMDFVSEYL